MENKRILEHAKKQAIEDDKIAMYLFIYKLLKEEMDKISPINQISS